MRARSDQARGATPSQTVGPFFGHALPFPGGGDLAPAPLPAARPGETDVIGVHGFVWDGAGEPVPDALLEFWQPDRSGRGDTGSLSRDGVRFTGFGRVPTDPEGHWVVRTLRPDRGYLSICVFARGLLRHLFTRAYLRPDRRFSELLAIEETTGVFRFDIHLQGPHETTFLEFTG